MTGRLGGWSVGAEGSYDVVEMDPVEILAEHAHFCEICGKGERTARDVGESGRTWKNVEEDGISWDDVEGEQGICIWSHVECHGMLYHI